MEHYSKGEVKEAPDDWESLGLVFDSNVVHMRVSTGSKIRNVMGFAMKKIMEPSQNQLTWNASGKAVGKAISCAEIMKKKIKGLHQINKIRFKRIEEYWDPQRDDLDKMCVNRDIPAITILLSKTPLDETVAGYQAPDSNGPFNIQPLPDKRKKAKPLYENGERKELAKKWEKPKPKRDNPKFKNWDKNKASNTKEDIDKKNNDTKANNKKHTNTKSKENKQEEATHADNDVPLNEDIDKLVEHREQSMEQDVPERNVESQSTVDETHVDNQIPMDTS